MATDTALIYELAMGEGDEYAATFASILNSFDAAFEEDCDDDDFFVDEPDF